MANRMFFSQLDHLLVLSFDNIMHCCYKVLDILVSKIIIQPILYLKFKIELLMRFVVRVDTFGFVEWRMLLLVEYKMLLVVVCRVLLLAGHML